VKAPDIRRRVGGRSALRRVKTAEGSSEVLGGSEQVEKTDHGGIHWKERGQVNVKGSLKVPVSSSKKTHKKNQTPPKIKSTSKNNHTPTKNTPPPNPTPQPKQHHPNPQHPPKKKNQNPRTPPKRGSLIHSKESQGFGRKGRGKGLPNKRKEGPEAYSSSQGIRGANTLTGHDEKALKPVAIPTGEARYGGRDEASKGNTPRS